MSDQVIKRISKKLILYSATLFLFTGVNNAVHAQETSGDFSGGSVEIGDDNRACSGATEGNVRYNAATNKMEFCNATSWAPVQFEACSDSPASSPSSNNNAASVSDYTAPFSYTVGAGTQRLLVVGFLIEGSGVYEATAVTFDGNALTKIADATRDVSSSSNVSLWYIHIDEELGTGSHTGNIAVTLTGTPAPNVKMATVDYITNVNNKTPIGNYSLYSLSGTEIAVAYNTSANSITLDAAGHSINENMIPDNGQTEIIEVQSSVGTATTVLGTKTHGTA